MGVRQLIEWVTAGVIAGELAAATGTRGAVPEAVPSIVGVLGALALGAGAWRRTPSALWLGAMLVGMASGWRLVVSAIGVPPVACHVAHLPLPMEARLVGRVESVPLIAPHQTSFVLGVETVARERDAAAACGAVRVRVRGALADLRRGDRVRVATTLRRPRNFENPGGFDVVGLLARRGVHVTAAVWDAASVERLSAPIDGWLTRVDQWRATTRTLIARGRDPDVSAVMRALVLGDQAGIEPTLRDAFTRAGVVHVLSVSGLHVGIVGGAATLLVGWLLARSERLLLATDVRRVAVTASLFPAIAYGALAGFEVATLRSLTMAAALVAAVLLERRVGPARTLALAALGIAVAWPGAPAEISYQLSFGSVASLVFAAARAAPHAGPRWRRWATTAWRTSVAAWLGTAPLTALHFHQLSLVSPLANLVVIPLFGAVALLPALAGAAIAPVAPTIAATGFDLAALPVRAALHVVGAIGTWRWAAVAVPIPTMPELVLVYVVLASLAWRAHPVWRGVGVAALLLLAVDTVWWARLRSAPGVLRATFLDVGQGDAAVVELPDGRVLVIDAGGFPGSDYDTGAAIVEPFLRARKIQHVDALVMSHPHPDHAGGLAHLLRAFAPDELWSTGTPGTGVTWDETVQALVATATPLRVLHAGDHVPGYPSIEVLHPPIGWSAPSLNEGSLVIRIGDGTTTFLFAGDVETRGERTLLAAPADPSAVVLKVPHHGSRTSSTRAFAMRADPQIAVVSVGAQNRYGHPAPEVEARYARLGARVLRTDRCGAIEVVSDGRTVTVAMARPSCETVRPPARP